MKTPRAPASRKAKTKVAKVRRLKREFDAAHQAGMAGLRRGDLGVLDTAIAKERVIITRQAELIADSRLVFKKRTARKRKSGKKP